MQEGVNFFVHKIAFLPIVLRCENWSLSLRTGSICDGHINPFALELDIYILDFKLSPRSMCNVFFWVIPRRLGSNSRHFGTIGSIFMGSWMKNDWDGTCGVFIPEGVVVGKWRSQ